MARSKGRAPKNVNARLPNGTPLPALDVTSKAFRDAFGAWLLSPTEIARLKRWATLAPRLNFTIGPQIRMFLINKCFATPGPVQVGDAPPAAVNVYIGGNGQQVNFGYKVMGRVPGMEHADRPFTGAAALGNGGNGRLLISAKR